MAESFSEQHEHDSALFGRIRELESEGLDRTQAFGRAALEHRISPWPESYGQHLQILIFGDFEPPSRDVDLPDLRITIHKEKVGGSIIRSAMTVLKATVEIESHTIPAVMDAVRRINILLGAYTLVEWGNGACGWWSWVTHGTGNGVVGTKIDHADLQKILAEIVVLPSSIRRKVDAALYWLREPKSLLMEMHRGDALRGFSAYWNAFECLVEAVNELKPPKRLSPSQKQVDIDAFIKKHDGSLTSADVQECYQTIVNPGFVGKATHALNVCCGSDAPRYIEECFRLSEKSNRLYNIRNAINHGDVDAENFHELYRIEARLRILWFIVWRIFGQLIPLQYPVESEPLSSTLVR